MELQFIRRDPLESLRKAIPENIEKYATNNMPWMDKFFQEKEIKVPSFDSGIEIPENIVLTMGGAESDAENAVILHEAFRNRLLPVQATDRRMWVYLTHVTFWDYMRKRWPVENTVNESGMNGTVTDRYFLSRGLFRNGISRLYWVAELTYDESLSNPYEYTRFLFGDQDLINQIDGRSFCRNRTLLQAILGTLQKHPDLSETQKDNSLKS